MMGNLSPGLKNHAVTMFEVGKLTDEVLGSFLTELGKVWSIKRGNWDGGNGIEITDREGTCTLGL